MKQVTKKVRILYVSRSIESAHLRTCASTRRLLTRVPVMVHATTVDHKRSKCSSHDSTTCLKLLSENLHHLAEFQ